MRLKVSSWLNVFLCKVDDNPFHSTFSIQTDKTGTLEIMNLIEFVAHVYRLQADADPQAAAWNHFVNAGIHEGRPHRWTC